MPLTNLIPAPHVQLPLPVAGRARVYLPGRLLHRVLLGPNRVLLWPNGRTHGSRPIKLGLEVVVAVTVLREETRRHGRTVSKIVGAALIVFTVFVPANPALLPGLYTAARCSFSFGKRIDGTG